MRTNRKDQRRSSYVLRPGLLLVSFLLLQLLERFRGVFVRFVAVLFEQLNEGVANGVGHVLGVAGNENTCTRRNEQTCTQDSTRGVVCART